MSDVIKEFLQSANAEGLPDSIYGIGYRCSAYLRDGSYLPCVMLRSAGPISALALRRFEEERRGKGMFRSSGKDAYEQIVRHFVATGNRVNAYDLAKIEPSPYAIPLALRKQIEGETTMSWTGFALEMADAKLFSYGTTFLAEFFQLPEGYSFSDVVRVHNHSYVSPNGELRPLAQGMSQLPADYSPSAVLRERAYFVCHYDE